MILQGYLRPKRREGTSPGYSWFIILICLLYHLLIISALPFMWDKACLPLKVLCVCLFFPLRVSPAQNTDSPKNAVFASWWIHPLTPSNQWPQFSSPLPSMVPLKTSAQNTLRTWILGFLSSPCLATQWSLNSFSAENPALSVYWSIRAQWAKKPVGPVTPTFSLHNQIK